MQFLHANDPDVPKGQPWIPPHDAGHLAPDLEAQDEAFHVSSGTSVRATLVPANSRCRRNAPMLWRAVARLIHCCVVFVVIRCFLVDVDRWWRRGGGSGTKTRRGTHGHVSTHDANVDLGHPRRRRNRSTSLPVVTTNKHERRVRWLLSDAAWLVSLSRKSPGQAPVVRGLVLCRCLVQPTAEC